MNGTHVLSAQALHDRHLSAGGLDLPGIRRDFPALAQQVHGRPLVYFDNAASTQKPRVVLDAMTRYYESDNANVHRGVHALGDRSTARFERARETVQRFLNAPSPHEIVFVRGATEALNLVAQTFGRQRVGPGDEIVISWMEHHANIVPWQLLCGERGATLRVAPIDDQGDLRLDAFENLLTPRTKLVALSHVSNVLGTINPVKALIAQAHRRGIPVCIDGAQAVSHLRVDVQDLDCDFYAFSSHKVYGPMGIGVLFGKASHLKEMPPWQAGGDMIRTVSFEQTTFNDPPYRFEAGTPNVAGAVGMAAALDELERLGRDAVSDHEALLLDYARERLATVPGVRAVGDPAQRAGVLSFVVEEPALSALDVGTRLDLQGIAVRTGHHCCQPLMRRLGVGGTVRASFALYNTYHEVDRFITSLRAILADESAARRPILAAETSGGTAPSYPPASAETVAEAAEGLAKEVDGLDDWSERYQFLIELGRDLPVMPDALKTEPNRVRGWQSTVFLAARTRPGTTDVVEFLADSDGEIVRGLIAVLQQLLSGQRAAEIVEFDLRGFFARIGLESNLTTSRRNGLFEMIKRLRGFAAGVEALRQVDPVGNLGVAI